jgi:putative hydrolase of the HAD superfamily
MGSPEIHAVLWDFGGVLTTSPFDAFTRFEEENGLPRDFIRTLNATDPDVNAWARFERADIDVDEFVVLFEAEAAAAGHSLDARKLLPCLRGQLRPSMVEALRRCHSQLRTALLTNNFIDPEGSTSPNGHGTVLDHFDVVIESSKAGCRKPDPRFYELALEMLGVAADKAVFLDDLGINLKPARALGMQTIKVTDPDLAIEQLQSIVGFDLI